MQDKPSLFLSGFLLISSGILIILSMRIDDERLAWLKFILLVIAGVVGFYGLVQLVVWLSWTVLEVREQAIIVAREASEARYPVVLAHALERLPQPTAEFVGRSTIMEVIGIMDDSLNLEFGVECVGGVRVEWGFIQDYILASKATWPQLLPVSDAYSLGYINAERQASALISSLTVSGWVDPAAGNRSARALAPYKQFADKFMLGGQNEKRNQD